MALVLIESPNKIPKLKKILGSKYTVMASVGHIMDLPKGKPIFHFALLGCSANCFQSHR